MTLDESLSGHIFEVVFVLCSVAIATGVFFEDLLGFVVVYNVYLVSHKHRPPILLVLVLLSLETTW